MDSKLGSGNEHHEKTPTPSRPYHSALGRDSVSYKVSSTLAAQIFFLTLDLSEE